MKRKQQQVVKKDTATPNILGEWRELSLAEAFPAPQRRGRWWRLGLRNRLQPVILPLHQALTSRLGTERQSLTAIEDPAKIPIPEGWRIALRDELVCYCPPTFRNIYSSIGNQLMTPVVTVSHGVRSSNAKALSEKVSNLFGNMLREAKFFRVSTEKTVILGEPVLCSEFEVHLGAMRFRSLAVQRYNGKNLITCLEVAGLRDEVLQQRDTLIDFLATLLCYDPKWGTRWRLPEVPNSSTRKPTAKAESYTESESRNRMSTSGEGLTPASLAREILAQRSEHVPENWVPFDDRPAELWFPRDWKISHRSEHLVTVSPPFAKLVRAGNHVFTTPVVTFHFGGASRSHSGKELVNLFAEGYPRFVDNPDLCELQRDHFDIEKLPAFCAEFQFQRNLVSFHSVCLVRIKENRFWYLDFNGVPEDIKKHRTSLLRILANARVL